MTFYRITAERIIEQAEVNQGRNNICSKWENSKNVWSYNTLYFLCYKEVFFGQVTRILENTYLLLIVTYQTPNSMVYFHVTTGHTRSGKRKYFILPLYFTGFLGFLLFQPQFPSYTSPCWTACARGRIFSQMLKQDATSGTDDSEMEGR